MILEQMFSLALRVVTFKEPARVALTTFIKKKNQRKQLDKNQVMR